MPDFITKIGAAPESLLDLTYSSNELEMIDLAVHVRTIDDFIPTMYGRLMFRQVREVSKNIFGVPMKSPAHVGEMLLDGTLARDHSKSSWWFNYRSRCRPFASTPMFDKCGEGWGRWV